MQNIHTFSARVINEARVGYNFIRRTAFGQQPVKDSTSASDGRTPISFPGLGQIRIAPNAGAVIIGTNSALSDLPDSTSPR